MRGLIADMGQNSHVFTHLLNFHCKIAHDAVRKKCKLKVHLIHKYNIHTMETGSVAPDEELPAEVQQVPGVEKD
jgi:hypothetical protein